MPTLQNIQGSSLVPDTSNLNNLLLNVFGTKQSREKDQIAKDKLVAEQEAINVILGNPTPGPGAIDESGATGTPASDKQKEQALVRLATLNPQAANAIRQTLERGDKLELQQVQQEAEKGTRLALQIKAAPTFTEKQKIVSQEAQQAAARGEDVSRFVDLSNMSESQLDLELDKMIIQGGDLKTLTKAAVETEDTPTPGGEIIKASEISDGFVVRQQPDGSFTKTKVLESSKVSDGGKASAVTKIFGNGTTVQALPNGQVVVKNPAGQIVEGDERVETLSAANASEVDQAGLKKGTEAAATAAIKQSEKNFEQLAGIKTAVNNIDNAIQAIDDGANTGVIASKLPSIKAASIKLDNLQKRLGLDVIGNVTFGALSKGELDLALATALPTNLDEAELRAWLVDKRDAQLKLATYVEDAAVFLGTPGNTMANWIEIQKEISDSTAAGNKSTSQPIEVDF